MIVQTIAQSGCIPFTTAQRRARALLLLLAIFQGGCADQGTQPVPNDTGVSLQLVDVASREVYLKLSVDQAHLADTVLLQRDGVAIHQFSRVPDTTLIDTGLTPNSLHQYTVLVPSVHSPSQQASALCVRTLALSNSNFSWQSYLLGEGQDSYLSGVAIINDTLAYAVGEVYKTDSTGRLDPDGYNLAKWNGSRWTLSRIQFFTICGQASRSPYPASSVLCLADSDVWVAMAGNQIARWNGTVQTQTARLPADFSIGALWGSSSNSVYAVGSFGTILHYADGTWTPLQSATTRLINDVWGVLNKSSTGEVPVFCAASETLVQPGGNGILEITGGTTVQALPSDPTIGASSVWTQSGTPLYASGTGLWRFCSGSWQKVLPGSTGYLTQVRGNALNDIAMVDVSSTVSHIYHFDGAAWRMFTPQTGLPQFGYVGLAMRGNLLIAVGSGVEKALIIVGRR